MYEASCYSSENENKLKEICFIKNYILFYKWMGRDLIEGGGGGGKLNKYLHLKMGGGY